jgi:2-amino-4-hydroxy-6-hydroxymethyldihydropteridine diphosphokinase
MTAELDPDWDAAVVVALGGNLAGPQGGPEVLLEAALDRFPGAGLFVKARSGWWRSAAWPDPAAPSFLNGVVIVETTIAPGGVLTALLEIERLFGRDRGVRNAPRTLDLDLVAYGRLINED